MYVDRNTYIHTHIHTCMHAYIHTLVCLYDPRALSCSATSSSGTVAGTARRSVCTRAWLRQKQAEPQRTCSRNPLSTHSTHNLTFANTAPHFPTLSREQRKASGCPAFVFCIAWILACQVQAATVTFFVLLWESDGRVQGWRIWCEPRRLYCKDFLLGLLQLSFRSEARTVSDERCWAPSTKAQSFGFFKTSSLCELACGVRPMPRPLVANFSSWYE